MIAFHINYTDIADFSAKQGNTMSDIEDVYHETIAMPDYISMAEDSEEVTAMAFIAETEESKDELVVLYSSDISKNTSEISKEIQDSLKVSKEKSFEHSNQDLSEIGEERFFSSSNLQDQIIEPPYPPECMAKYLEIDDVHFRAVKTKVTDSVGRKYNIKSSKPISKGEGDDNTSGDINDITVTVEEFQTDSKKITDFISNCNEHIDFEEICYKVGMDKEGVGWGAFEVIRQADGKIARLNHLPATRLRVLKGARGFVEILDGAFDKYTYYQLFGDKVVVDVPNPFDPSGGTYVRPYNPEEDGELQIGKNKIRFNFASKEFGKELEGGSAESFQNAANEILFIPTPHSNSVYYGYSDGIPAIGAILANTHIRDYLLQFFEHNCVPRFAVVVKGAKVDDKFKKLISEYFENKIKGSAHKTLILTLSGMGNKNIDIKFEKIDADRKEGDFMETRRSNNQIIMTSHGTSASILGINETASLGSGSGLSQAELYKDRIVLPLQLYWARRLNKLFRLGLGVTNAVIQYDPFDIRDTLASAQAMQILLQQGVLTINEARRELGIPGSIEGGDIPILRVREGSLIRVDQIPDIKARLADNEFEVETDSNNEKFVDLSKLVAPKYA